ncbi:DUF3006 domain-containing protein [Halosimplex salinum]|uniref:DUF3006 domain-containing protein n=1 Tax=Halosimplex salinum TaxID=1710538 RepID=UPI000F4A25BD|nr:DUF3006 domain-containing protein [Halosimplex salinum]
MIPDGNYTAVVDRIEDGLATLEVTDEEETDRYELVVDPEELPESGRHADAVLRVELDDGDLVDAAYDESETEERADAAQSRFDRLSERRRGDDTGSSE